MTGTDSMRLSELVGQEQAVAVLRLAMGSGRVPHAYLFAGPPGVGKRSAAVALGTALACPKAPGDGCGACETCRRIAAGTHPDVQVFAPDLWCPERGGKGCGRWVPPAGCPHERADKLPVDAVRDVIRLASDRPHEAPRRVLVVDDAELMMPNAANALLKTLEEPAPDIHLVLCSAAPARLLPTVMSRVQPVRFGPVPAAKLGQLLEARGVARARAETAVAMADGSVARAIDLAAGGDQAAWQAAVELRAAITAGTAGAVFDAATAHGEREAKDALPATLGAVERLYRDALVTAAGAPDLALGGEHAGAARELASAGAPALSRSLAALAECREALAGNVNAVLALERLLFALRREAPA